MKNPSRIFLVFLSTLLIVNALSACGSGSAESAQSTEIEISEEPIDGLYVFSFLDRYYRTVRMIQEAYTEEIYTDVLEIDRNDPIWGEILNLHNDDVRAYVDLPCGTGYVRKTSFVLESLDMQFMDINSSEEDNHTLAVEAMAVFHSIECDPLPHGYDFYDPSDALSVSLIKKWKQDFEESIKTFNENISKTANDPEACASMVQGKAVLAYSGKYNYSLYMKNLGDASPSKEDHYVMSLKIEAN